MQARMRNEKREAVTGGAPARPLRLFARPEPIEALAEVPDGPPLRFRWRRVLHDVTAIEGPERIAAPWWRHAGAPTRDYFRAEDSEGRRFWLYREGLWGRETMRPKWFVHGLFG
jgi:protein ImuB